LQKTEKVELLFAKDNKLIGMRPCSPDVKNGHTLKKQGRSNSYLLRGRSHCNTYGVRPKATVLFEEPKVDEEGILILNLKKVSKVPMRSPRSNSTEKPYTMSLFEEPE
jgi:hypothetical protein